MASAGTRYLVVVADDFGRSASVNAAIAEAHEKGIVTAASIMPGGPAFAEAVAIARGSGRLSVGLHLTLCDGAPVLPLSEIGKLAGRNGRFEPIAARAWIRYYRSGLVPALKREIEAQFDLLEEAGISPDHVDGHHHLHLHPTIFPLVCSAASKRGVRWIRIPREPFSRTLGRTGRGVLPPIEWTVFGLLGRGFRKEAGRRGIRTADRVAGLARTGSMNERNLLEEIGKAREAVVEIFAHPDTSTAEGRRELQALVSPAVALRVASQGFRLAGYRELSGAHVRRQAAGEAG